jgi:hypothetical protein
MNLWISDPNVDVLEQVLAEFDYYLVIDTFSIWSSNFNLKSLGLGSNGSSICIAILPNITDPIYIQ